MGERIAAAPNASPDAFIASVWDHGIEKAAELVESIASFRTVSDSLDSQINEVAWNTDVQEARNLLASHTGIFRYLNGNWRKARGLVGSLLRDRSLPVEQQILYKLIKAQAEKKKIQEGNDFGHSAFGSDWRGERSDSSSLMALVEWMRTLRGVGAEARLLASRLIDRESVKLRAQQLSQLLQQVRTPLDILWGAFGFSPEEYFSNQVSITRVSLGYIEEKVQNLIAIDEQCFRVMVNPPARIDERYQLITRMIELQKLIAEIRAETCL